MDELNEYRRIVRELVEEYGRYPPSVGDVRTEVIIDEEQGHYELMHSGWVNRRRVHGSVLHLDIIDGKVWVQYDGTDVGVADELAEAGIPRDRIVLAFKSPEVRPLTGFAVG